MPRIFQLNEDILKIYKNNICHVLLKYDFLGKAGVYPSGALMVLHFLGRLLILPAMVRLGWRWLTVTNSLAYYDA